MMPQITTSLSELMLVGVGAYLLGSIPFGVVITRVFGLGDLRQIGSGNIGATNVLRMGSKGAAFLTLLLDGGKGVFAVVCARALVGEDAAHIAALWAMIGHCFPVYLGFRGGKGVATFLGVLLAISPFLGAAACASWLVVAALTKISSAAALAATALSIIWAALLFPMAVALTGALTLLIWARHWENIVRIVRKQEPKIGQK